MSELPPVLGKRILLAEDEPAVRESLRLMLDLDQHIVIEACNGREALALFSSQDFDLVITDYLMPEMQGDELARNIERIAPARPVLLVTAYREKLADLGRPADAILDKPFDLNGLRRAIARRLQVAAALDKHSFQSSQLSPQRLRTRASSGSQTLTEILGLDSDTSFLRGWGINE